MDEHGGRDEEYEVLRERIRRERSHGAPDGPREYEPVIADLARELGEVVEGVLRLGTDQGRDLGLRVLEALASSTNPTVRSGLGTAARLGFSLLSPAVSRTAGEVASVTSLWAMRAGFGAIRELHRMLESRR